MIIVVGLFITVLGVLILFAPKIPFIGRLPGDFYFKRGNFSFYFPLATSIILSIILTLLLNFILRGK
ncbi:MAG: DUF2905 family protein [Candidatus Aenigmarchaeota archaeon]|nr:DUF2905 family protein [Candidatus Aenigmarchaeota archaeon]